jgi:uncharacterized protein (TIGR03067 family)
MRIASSGWRGGPGDATIEWVDRRRIWTHASVNDILRALTKMMGGLMCVRLLLLSVMLLSVGFAPAPFTKSKESIERADFQKLQGVWIGMSRLCGGKNDMPTSEVGTISMVVDGNSLKYVRQGKVITEWTFTIDATPPKTLDTKEVGENGRHFLSLYAFEKSSLRLCYYAGHPTRRPRSIEGKDTKEYLEVFERKKP